jgi:hypothetical protein
MMMQQEIATRNVIFKKMIKKREGKQKKRK